MIRKLATSAALVALAGLQLAFMPGRAQAAQQFDVISVNISGDELAGDSSALASLNNQITSATDAVVVVESCRSQFEAFKAGHQNWSTHFWSEGTRSTCQNGPYAGELVSFIASRNPMSNLTTTDMTDGAAGRNIGMPCADVGGFNVTLCAVHLIAGGDERKGDRKTQIGELNDALRAKWNAQPVVVAGDFNTTPDSGEMNDMYRLTKSGTFQGAGQFHEADMTDPANPSTKPSTVTCNSAQSACRWGQTTRAGGVNKIDYIFFNRQFTSIGSLTASTFAQGANQDHRGVKGSAMIG